MMATRRFVAAALAATGTYVGTWAAGFPHSFYASFPGLHRTWVSLDGPFNEHLVRDVGGLYLGLAVVAARASISRDYSVQALAGGAWSTFSLIHVAYHATHLHALEPLDRIISITILGVTLLGALLLLVRPRRPRSRSNETVTVAAMT